MLIPLPERLACPPAQEEKLRVDADKTRAALPGDPRYVPFPFPQTDEAVVADLAQQVERMESTRWANERQHSLPHYLGLRAVAAMWDSAFDAATLFGVHVIPGTHLSSRPMREGQLRYAVGRVEDWTELRCMPGWGQTILVVRVFDADSGEEIWREALDDAGHYGMGSSLIPKEARFPWPDPSATTADISRRIGLSLRPLGLVRSSPLCEDQLYPCVAMATADGRFVYLWNTPRRTLFRAPLGEPYVRPSIELTTPEAWQARLRSLPADHALVSLGPDRWAVAERVPVTEP